MFRTGDRIKVKTNLFTGTIEKVKLDTNEYGMRWDHNKSSIQFYDIDECDKIWELEKSIYDDTILPNTAKMMIGIIGAPPAKKCECGVDKVNIGKHSDWCPKHGGN